MEDTPFHWIDNEDTMQEGLAVLIDELKQCPLLAVDLEFCDVKLDDGDSSSESCGIIALIQMSTVYSDYIVDCLQLRDIIRADHGACSLRAVFQDAAITKILHGSDSDQRYLVGDLGIATINLFDTARAFAFLQRFPSVDQIK